MPGGTNPPNIICRRKACYKLLNSTGMDTLFLPHWGTMSQYDWSVWEAEGEVLETPAESTWQWHLLGRNGSYFKTQTCQIPGSVALLLTRATCSLCLIVLKLQCGMNGIYYSVQEESIYLSFAQSFKAFLSPVNSLLV